MTGSGTIGERRAVAWACVAISKNGVRADDALTGG